MNTGARQNQSVSENGASRGKAVTGRLRVKASEHPQHVQNENTRTAFLPPPEPERRTPMRLVEAQPIRTASECGAPIVVQGFQARNSLSAKAYPWREGWGEGEGTILPSKTCNRAGFVSSGFTLIELLVVLAIIGLLASLTLPRIGTMNRSSAMASATQQLLDDCALARRLAILNRTTVLMVFLPPQGPGNAAAFSTLNPKEQNILLRGQLTTYALFSFRQVGDQPGQEHPRFLKSWTSLPDGFIFPEWKFPPAGVGAGLDPSSVVTFVPPFLEMMVPVPSLNSVNARNTLVPYIAFGPEGRLQKHDGNAFVPLNAAPGQRAEEVIPLARGSLFLERNVDGSGNEVFAWTAPDVIEKPAGNSTNNYNLVVIDHLTGRARVVRPEIQ